MSEKQKSSRSRKSVIVPPGVESSVADGQPSQEPQAVGKNARSRRYLGDRLHSAKNYGQFAAAAGADIFDGEPLDRFAAVGKLDERVLRMRAQELREKVFTESLKKKG